MISPETRDRKPYAMPVQLVPYAGLTQKKIRSLINGVIKEMVKQKLEVCSKYILSIVYLNFNTTRCPILIGKFDDHCVNSINSVMFNRVCQDLWLMGNTTN